MPKKKSKKSSNRPLLKLVLWVLLGLVAAFVVLLLLVRGGAFGKLPSKEELAAVRNEEATLVLANDGSIIGKIFAEDRTNIPYSDLPKHLIDALVATEDQRFFDHKGVDGRSYLRVFFRSLLGGDRSGGGGSTISQQIIKNLYGRERHGILTVPVNKMKEAIVATRLEEVYTKEDVLMLYFNSVPFGENVYGVEAAARRFFSKPAKQLRAEEAAVLVGMLKANTTYNPRLNPKNARGRRDQVLELMSTRGYIAKELKDSLRALPLTVRYAGNDALDDFGYFTHRVKEEATKRLEEVSKATGKTYDLEKDGLRIKTTLDPALHRLALLAIEEHLSAMQPKLDRELRGRKARTAWEKRMSKKSNTAWKRDDKKLRDVFAWEDTPADTMSYRDSLWHYERMLNGAVLMMEPGSGSVRAWVGGNDHRYLPYDQVLAKRPIASAIKPVIYAAALEKGLQPCDYFNNEPRVYTEYDDWEPHNFDHDTTGGRVAMWHALARSMNLPTVDLYFRTGADTVGNTLKALGLPSRDKDKPAISLGALDISLQEIVRAYAAFAMRGTMVQPRMIEQITDAQGVVLYKAQKSKSSKAVQAVTAATITAMLQRAVDQGTGAALRSRYGVSMPLAGKTGTSQDYGDAWFIGYTPGLVMGTWVGARDPKIHFSSGLGSGSQLALPIAGSVFAAIERTPDLRKRYVRSFDWIAEYDIDLDCDPTRDPGALEELIESVFRKKTTDYTSPPEDSTKQEKKNLFERLFKKK
ncbi:MAG: transglycosylase domain-containing protein [Flavobacteriales bacterium]|nr:transglycosylase domain-containing protein [Flavobacteriales bacterium]